MASGQMIKRAKYKTNVKDAGTAGVLKMVPPPLSAACKSVVTLFGPLSSEAKV